MLICINLHWLLWLPERAASHADLCFRQTVRWLSRPGVAHTIKFHFTGSHDHRFPTWTSWAIWKALGVSGLQDAMGLRVGKTQRKQDKVQKSKAAQLPHLSLRTFYCSRFQFSFVIQRLAKNFDVFRRLYLWPILRLSPHIFRDDWPYFSMHLLWRRWRSNDKMALSQPTWSPREVAANPANNLFIDALLMLLGKSWRCGV